MRLVMLSLAALSASTACVALLFVYALVAPTRPAPGPSVTGLEVPHISTPVERPMVTAASELR